MPLQVQRVCSLIGAWTSGACNQSNGAGTDLRPGPASETQVALIEVFAVHQRNYLNLPAEDRDRYIYRIISVDRFKELLQGRHNTLVKPSSWGDPFENFILKSRVRLETGELASMDFHDQYYAQCWTLQTASDAMWRIYSPNALSVRVRTTIRGLAESLSATEGEWAGISVFIGRVQYLSNNKLLDFAQNVFRDGSPRKFAETLLVKRPAFRHEREIRLIFFQRDASRKRQPLYPYPLNSTRLIDQVMTDPRLTSEQTDRLHCQIREMGFQGPLKRSLLYAPPPNLVIPFGHFSS